MERNQIIKAIKDAKIEDLDYDGYAGVYELWPWWWLSKAATAKYAYKQGQEHFKKRLFAAIEEKELAD